MTHNYVKNILGCRLSEAQMEDIPCPRLELMTHVTGKTIQCGAVAGAVVVGPLVSVARGQRDFKSIQEASYQYGKKGAILGCIIGPALMVTRLISMDFQGAYDRAYRLRFNSQVFVDRICVMGTLAGVGSAHFMGADLKKGAFVGFTGGCLVGGVLNALF